MMPSFPFSWVIISFWLDEVNRIIIKIYKPLLETELSLPFGTLAAAAAAAATPAAFGGCLGSLIWWLVVLLIPDAVLCGWAVEGAVPL